ATRPASDRSAAQGGQGDAPPQPPLPRADQQAEDLRGARAPARGTGAEAAAAGGLMAQTQIAQYQGTGKRKTSVARVILRPGDGATWFNGRTIEEYFPRAVHRQTALAPLKVAELEGRYDIRVRVHGGGPSGQAGAVRHGVALWSGRGRVFVGRDTRASGVELEEALARGIASAGGNAVLAGVLPTPAVALLALDVGAVITASHNPPEYNGVKFFDSHGQKL